MRPPSRPTPGLRELTFTGSCLALLALGLLASCSDPPNRPPTSTDATGRPGIVGGGGSDGGSSGSLPTDGGADSSTDAGACTALANQGGVVDLTAVADTLPAGTGGTIEDGTYVLTDAKIYVGNTGQPGLTNATYQITLTLSGSNFERALVYKNASGVTTEQKSKGTFVSSGVTGSFNLTCPSALQESVAITVASTTITFGNTITKEAFTFTKKP